MSEGAAASRDLARIVAARLAVSAAVLALGFRSVSDDDFSRTVIAQQLVAAPKLDPSGTSWLPFPFWLNGAAMLLLGRSLLAAQIVAVVLGVASSVLVALAARRLFGSTRVPSPEAGAQPPRDPRPLFAGLFATLVGWSAWLGVAAVPELFTASLTLFAAASLASPAPRDRLLGGLALLAATLSRYEPWPVAAGFAVWNAVHVAKLRAAPRAPRDRFATLTGGLASLLALAGPVLWIAWNRAAHGDAFHFVARVTAYRRALGDTSREGTLARLAAYPAALAREMPEVVVPALVLVLLALAPRGRGLVPGELRGAVLARVRACAAPLGLALLQLLALSVALVKDGAPTHHPERAVLFPALALVVFVAGFADARLPPGGLARRAPLVLGVAALLLLVRAAVLPALARRAGPTAPSLWAHLVRRVTPREAFIDRRAEVEIGALAAASAAPGAKVHIEHVVDYGYFAILAGSGRPEAFVLAEDPDPRVPKAPKPPVSPSAGESEYGQFLRAQGVTLVIAPAEAPTVAPRRWGAPPLHRTARFSLWKVP